MDLSILPGVDLREDELVEQFVRAAGPGGQNVNKVSTAVELRYDVMASSLPEWLKLRVLARRDRRLTKDGVLVISAMRFRTQDRNRSDARERLAQILRDSAVIEKARIASKPTRASQRRRIEGKKARGQVKTLRSRVSDE